MHVSAGLLWLIAIVVFAASLASLLLTQTSLGTRGRWLLAGNGSLAVLILFGAIVVALLCTALLPHLEFGEVESSWTARIPSTADSPHLDADQRVPPSSDASPAAAGGRAQPARSIPDPSTPELVAEPQSATGAIVMTSTSLGRSAPASTTMPNSAHLDPWAATACVYPVYLPTPSPGGERWKLENECGADVALVLATCSHCGSAPRWTYEPEGRLLPAKFRRTVTEVEEMVHGQRLIYAACFVDHPRAVGLIAGSDLLDEQTRGGALQIVWDSDRCAANAVMLSRQATGSGRQLQQPNMREAPAPP